MLALDHIVLAINDLEAGIRQLTAETGIDAVHGGSHPLFGTQNALVSLGNDNEYLEILAPDPAADDSSAQAALASYEKLTPVFWAVASTDIHDLKETLDAAGFQSGEVTEGARETPDGKRLGWWTLRLTDPPPPVTPFFIEWTQGTRHPSTTSPPGCTLARLRLETPEPETLRRLFALIDLETEIEPAEDARLSVVLFCPAGEARF